jgi:hypothetical protein
VSQNTLTLLMNFDFQKNGRNIGPDAEITSEMTLNHDQACHTGCQGSTWLCFPCLKAAILKETEHLPSWSKNYFLPRIVAQTSYNGKIYDIFGFYSRSNCTTIYTSNGKCLKTTLITTSNKPHWYAWYTHVLRHVLLQRLKLNSHQIGSLRNHLQ